MGLTGQKEGRASLNFVLRAEGVLEGLFRGMAWLAQWPWNATSWEEGREWAERLGQGAEEAGQGPGPEPGLAPSTYPSHSPLITLTYREGGEEGPGERGAVSSGILSVAWEHGEPGWGPESCPLPGWLLIVCNRVGPPSPSRLHETQMETLLLGAPRGMPVWAQNLALEVWAVRAEGWRAHGFSVQWLNCGEFRSWGRALRPVTAERVSTEASAQPCPDGTSTSIALRGAQKGIQRFGAGAPSSSTWPVSGKDCFLFL